MYGVCGSPQPALASSIRVSVSPQPPTTSTATVRLEVVELWERLFADDDGKDVELVARDGSIRAHSVILCQLSEPLRCILCSGMRETLTKAIEMRDYSVAELTFTLRLAYTGHVDPVDYLLVPPASEGASTAPAPRPPPPTESTSTQRPFLDGLASLVPRPPPPTDGLPTSQVPRPPSWLAPSVPQLVRSSPGCSSPSPGLPPCPPEPSTEPPIDILFGCASIAKRFAIPGLVTLMLDKLKPRVDAQNFDKVMRFAVGLDLSPLKLWCLKFAESNSAVQQQYLQGLLSPEVEFELRAVWSSPPPARGQKRKAFY